MVDLDTLKIDSSESLEDINALLYRLGVTDGLPVIPPTLQRVVAMLDGRNPEHTLALLPPMRGRATLRKLAICAVMAGCRPAYFPVLMAAIRAVVEPQFNLFGIQTTTGSATVMLLINGPIIDHCDLNAGANALGPGTQSNATIGRALQLALRNIGGAIPGHTDKATMGQPAKYTLCCAENAEASPWEPFHVWRGYAPHDSTVTVVGISGTVEVVDAASSSAASFLTTLAHSMTIAGNVGGGNMIGGGEPLCLLAPEHAAIIARDLTRQQAQEFLWHQARLPLTVLSPERAEHVRRTHPADALPLTELTVARRPDDIFFVVVGGIGAKSTYVPTWGGTTQAVTRVIDPQEGTR